MVTIRICALSAALVWCGTPVEASEPTAKTICPDECQRRAKTAFAFAKLKAEALRGPAAAPMPKPVERLTVPVPVPKLIGYREVCHNGRCYLVPIYEP